MLYAINKYLAFAAVILSAASLQGCSDGDREAAQTLADEAATAVESRDFTKALDCLDSLNSRYPSQTEIRRAALRTRAMAFEGIAIDSIQAADAALARATADRELWNERFRRVESTVGLEGYFIPVGAPEKVMTATGAQPRVSEKGFFYIVANVQGKKIGLNAIEFVDGATSISSSEISPARVVAVEGSESASFNPEDLEGVGEWIVAHPGASKLILKGSKSNATVKLNDKELSRFADCYNYSRALRAQRLASIHREKYERMLATARDQLANLPVSSDDKK